MIKATKFLKVRFLIITREDICDNFLMRFRASSNVDKKDKYEGVKIHFDSMLYDDVNQMLRVVG